MEDKLEVRKAIKKAKPTFKRSQTNQFSKFSGDGWRFPKGMGNKLRRGRKGHMKKPTPGYGSPSEVRGLNRAGMIEVMVHNVSDLANVTDSKKMVAVIGSTVGGKKKLELLKELKAKNIGVSNIKDLDLAIKKHTKVKVAKKVEKPKVEAKEAKEESNEKPTSENVKASENKKETSKEENKK